MRPFPGLQHHRGGRVSETLEKVVVPWRPHGACRAFEAYWQYLHPRSTHSSLEHAAKGRCAGWPGFFASRDSGVGAFVIVFLTDWPPFFVVLRREVFWAFSCQLPRACQSGLFRILPFRLLCCCRRSASKFLGLDKNGKACNLVMIE